MQFVKRIFFHIFMLDDKSKAAILSKFASYIKENNLRSTPERDMILAQVLDLHDMFELEDLRVKMAEISYYVSEATLYNTLNLFCRCGILYKHQFDDATSRYQRMPMRKGCQYLICRKCHKVKVVKDPEFMSFVNTKRYNAFTVEQFNVYVYGLCNNCLRRIKKEALLNVQNDAAFSVNK